MKPEAALHTSTCAYVAPPMVRRLRQDAQIYVTGLRNHFTLILFISMHLPLESVRLFSNEN